MTSEAKTQVQVHEFTSRHAPNIELTLSRYKERFYLISKYPYGHLDGHRFFYLLNPTTPPTGTNIRDAIDKAEKAPEERRLTFWSSHAADYQPDGTLKPGSAIHMLLDAEEAPVAKMTGRMRIEKFPGKEGSQGVACYEIEMLLEEEQLRRQCYYCLEFEDGTGGRYKPSGDETFWCSDCEKRGWAASATARAAESLVNDTIRPTVDKFVTETVNPVVGATPTAWAGNANYRENIYKL